MSIKRVIAAALASLGVLSSSMAVGQNKGNIKTIKKGGVDRQIKNKIRNRNRVRTGKRVPIRMGKKLDTKKQNLNVDNLPTDIKLSKDSGWWGKRSIGEKTGVIAGSIMGAGLVATGLGFGIKHLTKTTEVKNIGTKEGKSNYIDGKILGINKSVQPFKMGGTNIYVSSDMYGYFVKICDKVVANFFLFKIKEGKGVHLVCDDSDDVSEDHVGRTNKYLSSTYSQGISKTSFCDGMFKLLADEIKSYILGKLGKVMVNNNDVIELLKYIESDIRYKQGESINMLFFYEFTEEAIQSLKCNKVTVKKINIDGENVRFEIIK